MVWFGSVFVAGGFFVCFLRELSSEFDLENACEKGTEVKVHKINSQISLMGQVDF